MLYKRMPIEKESPEEVGYDAIDYNLSESSVTDIRFDELNISLENLKLEYIGHRGNTAFRKMIATEAGLRDEDAVLLTAGAAGALFIINTSLLTEKDHLIVVRPNYATNIEVPVTIGCSISYIDLQFEEKWKVNIGAIEEAITASTKLISITSPHNPTGMLMKEAEIDQLIGIAERNNLMLLVDETYRDACFKTPYPIMAMKSRNVISVSSLSKAFGLPGLRMGWLITRHQELMEQFLAAKEMIYISNSAIDEEVAYRFYRQKEKFANAINNKCMQNFETLQRWFQKEKRLECVTPQGGVVCFPRFTNDVKIDTEKFYSILMQQYKTMVGPGHWFAMPDTYMRIGFGWIDEPTLQQGLNNISKAIDLSIIG